MSDAQNQKGFVFSLEATITILVFSLLLLTINFPPNNSMNELLIIQQENDLLKIWSIDYPTNSEIVFDATELFGENGRVFVDGTIILNNTCFGETISSEAVILDDFLIKRNFVISICLS